MTEPTWIHDPALAGIDKAKLDFLQMLVSEGGRLSPKEMLPFFMGLSKRKKEHSIAFSKEEMELLIEVIKKNSTPAELTRMEQAMKLLTPK